MTSSWQQITVGDLVDEGFADIRTGPFGTQLRASDYTDDGVPVLNVRNLGFGTLRMAEIERVGDKVQARLSGHLLKEGDVVFGRKGAVDRHVLVASGQSGWMQGSDCIRLRILPESPVSPRFLSKALLTESHKAWMDAQCSHGATMASLNQEILRRISLDVPDTAAQQRVAAVLFAFDELIEINERRIELLENLARSLYREWFVHFRFPGHEDVEFVDSELGPIPVGWTVASFDDFAHVVVEGVKPSELGPASRYVGLEHLPRRRTTLREWGSINSVTSRKLRFTRGDTLFGKIRPYFHKVSWAPFSGAASSDTIVLRAHPGHELSGYVNAVASSDELVAAAVATSNGTKMPRADPKALLAFKLPRPDKRRHLEFERTVREWLEWSAALVQQNRQLATTRDLLLPRLVTGRLDISDVDLGVLTPAEAG